MQPLFCVVSLRNLLASKLVFVLCRSNNLFAFRLSGRFILASIFVFLLRQELPGLLLLTTDSSGLFLLIACTLSMLKIAPSITGNFYYKAETIY